MLSTNNTNITTFYESYKNACAPNPVLDLNRHNTYRYFEDFLLSVVNVLTLILFSFYLIQKILQQPIILNYSFSCSEHFYVSVFIIYIKKPASRIKLIISVITEV